MTRHYDAVVLGRSPGALAAAALLARQDLTVLLLGHGARPAAYRHDGRRLLRRSFTLLGATTPAFRRILHELAQTQRARRRLQPLDPMFAVLGPELRVEFPPDKELFEREMERELPTVRPLLADLHAELASANAAIDAAFEQPAIWPPGSLWERFTTGRVAAGLPFQGLEGERDLLARFAPTHPFRELFRVLGAFSSHLAVTGRELPLFALARLYGAWTRGVVALAGGEEELESFLVERIEAHGGECRLDERATRVVCRNGRVHAVELGGGDETVGTSAVITAGTGEDLVALTQGEGVTARARASWPRVAVARGRFVVSLIVADEGLPAPFPRESFLLTGDPGPSGEPRLHVQRLPQPEQPGETLLVVEALVSERGGLDAADARRSVLAQLFRHLPFLDRHVLVCDSPHDGLPLEDRTSGVVRYVDRIHLAAVSPRPEPMLWQWTIDPPQYLGLAGEPLRGPVSGTWLVGPTVLPALGQEGELMAALGVAQLITRRDRARQRLRRQLWHRVDTE